MTTCYRCPHLLVIVLWHSQIRLHHTTAPFQGLEFWLWSWKHPEPLAKLHSAKRVKPVGLSFKIRLDPSPHHIQFSHNLFKFFSSYCLNILTRRLRPFINNLYSDSLKVKLSPVTLIPPEIQFSNDCES